MTNTIKTFTVVALNLKTGEVAGKVTKRTMAEALELIEAAKAAAGGTRGYTIMVNG
jgi:hypothetical protein